MGDATTHVGFVRPRSPARPRLARRRPAARLVPLILVIAAPAAAMIGIAVAPFASGEPPDPTDLIRVLEARRRFKMEGRGLEAGPRLAVAVLDSGLNEAHVDFAGYERIPASRNLTP